MFGAHEDRRQTLAITATRSLVVASSASTHSALSPGAFSSLGFHTRTSIFESGSTATIGWSASRYLETDELGTSSGRMSFGSTAAAIGLPSALNPIAMMIDSGSAGPIKPNDTSLPSTPFTSDSAPSKKCSAS
jgi:hypothetical protein